jgi:hypothetical protein
VGRVVRTQRAGHFIGRADIDFRIQEIVTPSGLVYDGLTTKIVDIGKHKGEKGEVKANGEIQGPVHRERDTFLLLFPPTTLFQLLATPKRGPDVVIPVETRLYVKLMNPIYIENRVAAVTPAPAPIAVPAPPPVPRRSSYSIEVLVTPIALYPDTILHQVLVACTHPAQVIEASQWQQRRGSSMGNWDISVRTAFITSSGISCFFAEVLAAERRWSVAQGKRAVASTALGLLLVRFKPRSGERIFLRSAAHPTPQT